MADPARGKGWPEIGLGVFVSPWSEMATAP